MTEETNGMDRRTVLQSLAGLAVAGVVAASPRPVAADASARFPGKPGEFDFLSGHWTIRHRKRRTPGTEDWDEFMGEASVYGILGGVASVEELRIPSRNFGGMGLRLLDVEKKVWSDFWVDATSGVLTTPGTTGYFESGVGLFVADDEDDGKPVKIRGVWDRITSTSCRWYQGMSKDGGKTWEDDWFMDWTRA